MAIQVDVSGFSTALKLAAKGKASRRIHLAQSALIGDIIRDTEQYVPYDTGNLSRSVKRLPKSQGVEWEASYAKYVADMPQSYHFNKSVHHEATPLWVSESIRMNKSKWLSDFKRRLNGKS